MSKRNKPLGFNEEETIDSDAPGESPAELTPGVKEPDPRPRQANRPECPIHHVQMISYSTGAMYTYYRCPEPDCRERDKRVRPVGPLKDKYGHGKSARS